MGRGKGLHKRTQSSSLVTTTIATLAMARIPTHPIITIHIPQTTTTLGVTAAATTTTLVEDADVLPSAGLTTMEM